MLAHGLAEITVEKKLEETVRQPFNVEDCSISATWGLYYKSDVTSNILNVTMIISLILCLQFNNIYTLEITKNNCN